MSECVQLHVANLSDAHKAVLLFHDADGLTADEISQLLQLPLTTVKMRLHRARRKLQAALKEACDFGRDERGVLLHGIHLRKRSSGAGYPEPSSLPPPKLERVKNRPSKNQSVHRSPCTKSPD
jgi:hypothetical protein